MSAKYVFPTLFPFLPKAPSLAVMSIHLCAGIPPRRDALGKNRLQSEEFSVWRGDVSSGNGVPHGRERGNRTAFNFSFCSSCIRVPVPFSPSVLETENPENVKGQQGPIT